MQTSTQFNLEEFGFWTGEDDSGMHQGIFIIIPSGHILTEGGDIIAAESGDELTTQ